MERTPVPGGQGSEKKWLPVRRATGRAGGGMPGREYRYYHKRITYGEEENIDGGRHRRRGSVPPGRAGSLKETGGCLKSVA